jgi:hypothetical protein
MIPSASARLDDLAERIYLSDHACRLHVEQIKPQRIVLQLIGLLGLLALGAQTVGMAPTLCLAALAPLLPLLPLPSALARPKLLLDLEHLANH